MNNTTSKATPSVTTSAPKNPNYRSYTENPKGNTLKYQGPQPKNSVSTNATYQHEISPRQKLSQYDTTRYNINKNAGYEGRVAQALGAPQQQMMAPQMMAPQMMAPQMHPQMHPQMMAPQMHQQMQEGAPMQVNKAQIHKHFFGEGMPQGLNDVPQGLNDMPQIEKTSGQTSRQTSGQTSRQINLNPNGASAPGEINLNPNNLNEILPAQTGGSRKIRVSLIKF